MYLTEVKERFKQYRKNACKLLKISCGHVPAILTNHAQSKCTTNLEQEKEIFVRRAGYKPNLDNPQTFNEKIVYNKRHLRDPLMVTTSDKYAVRKYVAEKIGPEVLVPLLAVGDASLKLWKMPRPAIAKPTNASGRIAILRTYYEVLAAQYRMKQWLREPYGEGKNEWSYTQIDPKIVVEKLLIGEDGKLPIDYKYHCFAGKCKLVELHFDRLTDHTRTIYWPDWTLAPFEWEQRRGPDVPCPVQHTQMIEYAEILTAPFAYARADFYVVDHRVYFGEITHYPNSGFGRFDPIEWDKKLGEWL